MENSNREHNCYYTNNNVLVKVYIVLENKLKQLLKIDVPEEMDTDIETMVADTLLDSLNLEDSDTLKITQI